LILAIVVKRERMEWIFIVLLVVGIIIDYKNKWGMFRKWMFLQRP